MTDKPFMPDLRVLSHAGEKNQELEFTPPHNRQVAQPLRSSHTAAIVTEEQGVVMMFQINHLWFWGTPADLSTLSEALDEAAQHGRDLEAMAEKDGETIQ